MDLKKLLYALSMLRNQKTFGFVNGKGEFIKFIFEEDDTHCHSFISKANTPRCELRDADFEDLELIIQDLLLPLESEFSVVSIQST